MPRPMPMWAIRSILGPGGCRQEKFRPLAKPSVCWHGACKKRASKMRDDHWYCEEHSIVQLYQPMGFSSRTFTPFTHTNPTKVGNLDNWEYRFWIGDRFNYNGYATCRCCAAIVFNKAGRDDHRGRFEYPNCFVKLTTAYKEISKRGKCIVCKEGTMRRNWGIPLCGSDCEQRWMFRQTEKYVLLETELFVQYGDKKLVAL